MIDAVTKTLVDHLANATADLNNWIAVGAIDAEADAPVVDKLYVVLYGIEQHDYVRNLPLQESDAGLVRAPLHLRLSYVMTYFGTKHDEVQRRLARVVEVFHTTPILRAAQLDARLAERVDALTINLLSPSIDERNQLWTAMSRAMRLAVYYQVDVAPIPVTAREGDGRVKSLDVRYEVA